MGGFTLLSYPVQKDESLLSLVAERSRYMLPIGGRFRVIDFTLRNSVSSGAVETIIFNNQDDDLASYVGESPDENTSQQHKVRVVPFLRSDADIMHQAVSESESSYFVLYNGDIPSIINFSKVMEKFLKTKKKRMLVKLSINGKATMAHKVVITDKKSLLAVIKKSVKSQDSTPNYFEMLINMLIHTGITTSTVDAMVWTLKSVNEYYMLNREIIWNSDISSLLERENIIKSRIKANRFALLDEFCFIRNSFISDYCYINGTVENSIIFPGVEIGQGAIVKDSIILPFVKIAAGARVTNAIIDESTDPADERPNVGINCRVGYDEHLMENGAYPKHLHSGLTLVGKNNHFRDGIFIGAACYVVSQSRESYFTADRNRLYDGESLLPL
ncbi:MAG TPA: hypothetical protein PK514_12045 [Spirochaetota bacterium]|nr:hypothetical protein [Spirochaetota bacterium]